MENFSISQLNKGLREGEFSSKELTQFFLSQILKKDPEISAFLETNTEHAFEEAKKADLMIKEGKGGLLTGIPLAVKDNIQVRGFKTTCASKILENYQSPYDATVIS